MNVDELNMFLEKRGFFHEEAAYRQRYHQTVNALRKMVPGERDNPISILYEDEEDQRGKSEALHVVFVALSSLIHARQDDLSLAKSTFVHLGGHMEDILEDGSFQQWFNVDDYSDLATLAMERMFEDFTWDAVTG